MSSSVPAAEWKTLRAWQLAILRFALTLENADRLAVLAIASEIDRLGSQQDRPAGFSFFRKSSAELCAAILQPNSVVLRQYLARIDNDCLKRAMAATIEVDEPRESSVNKRFKRDKPLWRGLPSGGNCPL